MPRARSNAITRYPATAARAVKSVRRRRYKKRPSLKNIVNLGLGFPKKIMVTHKYIDNFSLTSTAGVPTGYSFSCNGMFDPNITGSGHQPMYYDQFTPLYDHYTVIGSKITVKVACNNSAAFPIVVGCFINDDNTITTGTLQAVAEQSSSKFVRTVTGTKPATYTLKWSAKKYFGRNVLANTELQGTATSNPTEQSYYNIYVQSMDGAANTTAAIWVEIDYIAVWKELKDVAQS